MSGNRQFIIMLKEKLKKLDFKFSDKYTTSASYLFKDGTFLNISEQQDILRNGTEIYHALIDDYLTKHVLSKEELESIKVMRYSYKSSYCIIKENTEILKFTDNAVVLNSGLYRFYEGNYIDLPLEELTSQQYESLTQYLDYLSYQPHLKTLQVCMRDKGANFKLVPEEVDNIIKEIKRWYNIEKNKDECK